MKPISFARLIETDLRPWFNPKTTAGWRAIAREVQGIPEPGDAAILEKLTGRTVRAAGQANECLFVIARRAGKSIFTAAWALYASVYKPHVLKPGDQGTFSIVAVDRKQSRVIFRYLEAFVDTLPRVAAMVTGRTAESIEFSNGCSIEISTANFRGIRGRTCIGAVLDELAFFRSDDAANPDYAIIDAIRPSMALVPDACLFLISSPHARAGALYDGWKKHHGVNGDQVLSFQAPTRLLNPTLSQSLVDQAIARDPSVARSEWLAEWRDDVSRCIAPEEIDRIVVDRGDLPPARGIQYVAATDANGGGADWFSTVIAHREGDRYIADVVKGWRGKELSQQEIVEEISKLLHEYRVRVVVGDKFSGHWVAQEFQRCGILYRFARMPASDAFLQMIPMLPNVEIPSHKQLIRELRELERRTSAGGRDVIGHMRSGHDDHAASLALELDQLRRVEAREHHLEESLEQEWANRPDGVLLKGESLSNDRASDRRSTELTPHAEFLAWAGDRGYRITTEGGTPVCLCQPGKQCQRCKAMIAWEATRARPGRSDRERIEHAEVIGRYATVAADFGAGDDEL